jgi:hypothetical protein
MEASLAVRENTPHRRDQPIEFDRRGVELVTPSSNRLFALARQRVRGQNDDRDVTGLRTLPPLCRHMVVAGGSPIFS